MKTLYSALLLACVLSACRRAAAQSGCTDPQAINYDPTAAVNDGSCTYEAASFSPPFITALPQAVSEVSGLAYANDTLWALNDSGNEAILWAIDTANGQVLNQKHISGATNTDWEALTQSEDYLFIGDIGNNEGERPTLRIYRIPKSALQATDMPAADTITFQYEDWSADLPPEEKKEFDCEAMAFFGDSLHLFTKGWNSSQTKHYVLPATPGNHLAQLRQSFDCKGQITDAAIDPAGALVLLGYDVQTAQSFLWLLYDTPMQLPPPTHPFSKNKRRIELGSVLANAQTEALAFVAPGQGIIGAEALGPLQARLLRLPTAIWWPTPTTSPHRPTQPDRLHILPKPDGFAFHWKGDQPIWLHLYHADGQPIARFRLSANSTRHWNANNIPSGIYFYTATTHKGQPIRAGALSWMR